MANRSEDLFFIARAAAQPAVSRGVGLNDWVSRSEKPVAVYPRSRWVLSLVLVPLGLLIVVLNTIENAWELPTIVALAAGLSGLWSINQSLCRVDAAGLTIGLSWRFLRFWRSRVGWGRVQGPAVVREEHIRNGPLIVAVHTDEGLVMLGTLPRYSSVLAALEQRLGPADPDARSPDQ